MTRGSVWAPGKHGPMWNEATWTSGCLTKVVEAEMLARVLPAMFRESSPDSPKSESDPPAIPARAEHSRRGDKEVRAGNCGVAVVAVGRGSAVIRAIVDILWKKGHG